MTTRDGIEDIGADALEVIDGALVFLEYGRGAFNERPISVAFAPTTWITVTRDED
ncbi:hypothetical protein [Cellulosimicrobium funkei]|uniref:hypothetical protein n=1 Tax=Cellulosimicrobium funkei TaxID=264251 RepID=UPI003443E180